MSIFYYLGLFTFVLASVSSHFMSTDTPLIWAIWGFAFVTYSGLQEIKDVISESQNQIK